MFGRKLLYLLSHTVVYLKVGRRCGPFRANSRDLRLGISFEAQAGVSLEIFLSEELAGVRAVQYPNCLCLNPGACLCVTVLRANHLYLGAFGCIGLQRLLPAGFAVCALPPHGGVGRVMSPHLAIWPDVQNCDLAKCCLGTELECTQAREDQGCRT